MRTALVLSSALLLAACGGNSAPANEPSSTPASSSSGSAPVTSTSATAEPTPNAPSMPEGKCGAAPKTTATALDGCLADCEKLEDTVPAGAKCIPPRTSCKMQCNSQFKK